MSVPEEILSQADQYAKEATCGIAYIKGFPLSVDQILGYLEIFNAYKKAANIIYDTEGGYPPGDVFYRSIYEDFMEFVDTDIPLNPEICAKILFTYTVHKIVAIYILHNQSDINTINAIQETQDMIENLVADNQWDALQRITGIEKLWQEI